jgi:hypothetical protein
MRFGLLFACIALFAYSAAPAFASSGVFLEIAGNWTTAFYTHGVDTLALVALHLGQCPQALALQTRATRMEIASEQSKEKFQARIKTVQEHCAGK